MMQTQTVMRWWRWTAAGAVLLAAVGCGNPVSSVTKPIQSVASKVKSTLTEKKAPGDEPVTSMDVADDGSDSSKDDTADLNNRANSNDYDSSAPRHAPVSSAPKKKTTKTAKKSTDKKKDDKVANRKNEDPFAPATTAKSDDTVLSPLEKELTAKREEEERLARQFREYKDKARELDEMQTEIERRKNLTQTQIEKLETVMRMIEKDPHALDAKKEWDGAQFGQKPATGGEAYSSGGPAWNASQAADADPAEQPAFQPAVTRDEWAAPADGKLGVAGPPGLAAPAASSAAAPAASAPAAPAAVNGTILVAEGKGKDTDVILSVGSRAGVKKGALFSTSDGKGGKAVFVVTETYPTYCCAVIHPEFASADVEVNAPVVQIPQVPGK